MKNKLFIGLFILSLSLLNTKAQNLVFNPSFEDTLHCPTSPASVSCALGWMSFADSPDYFNPCASIASHVNAPYTFNGYQQAYDGQAFIGIIVNGRPNLNGIREYFGSQLTQPLIIGQKYFVSFYIVLGSSPNNCWCNKIGAKFTTNSFHLPQWSMALATNSAQIYSDSIVKDTLNWMQIKGAFVADSAYKYIILGNFFDDAHTDTINCNSTRYTYMFFDKVSVSTDSSDITAVNKIANAEQIKIYPNPADSKISIDANDIIEIKLFDVLGKEIISSKEKEIDVTNLVNGIYFIQLKTNQNSYTQKIIVQH